MARNKLLGEADDAEEGKRYPLHLRTTRRLREELGDAATESGRSIAQEVEMRLEMSITTLPLLEEFATDKVALQLFRTLSDTLRSVRIRAAEKGWSEVETRQALRQAFGFVIDVNFWDGQADIAGPPDGYKVHGVGKRDTSPAQDGYQLAADRMVWKSAFDEMPIMDDFGEVVTDYWSGKGTVTVDAANSEVEPPSPRPLEEIMAEVSPRDRAAKRRMRKKQS